MANAGIMFGRLTSSPSGGEVRWADCVLSDGHKIPVRILPSSAGDHEPIGIGDRVLVGFAYNDPGSAYVLKRFGSGPPVVDAGNREIHAQSGKALRFVSTGGEVEVDLAGDGTLRLQTAGGLLQILSGDELLLEAVDGISLYTNLGDVEIVAPAGAVKVGRGGETAPVMLHEAAAAELRALKACVVKLASLMDPLLVAAGSLPGTATAAIVTELDKEGLTLASVFGGKPASNLEAEPA